MQEGEEAASGCEPGFLRDVDAVFGVKSGDRGAKGEGGVRSLRSEYVGQAGGFGGADVEEEGIEEGEEVGCEEGEKEEGHGLEGWEVRE